MDVQQLIDYLIQNRHKFPDGSTVAQCLIVDDSNFVYDVVDEFENIANPPSEQQLEDRAAAERARISLENAMNRKRPNKTPISREEALLREQNYIDNTLELFRPSPELCRKIDQMTSGD